jgi:hypothetical protein
LAIAYAGLMKGKIMAMGNAQIQDDGQEEFARITEQEEWESSADNPLNYQQTQLKHEKELKMNDINSMSFDQLVPNNSTYLTKNDVGDDGLILTIKGFKHETIKGDSGDETKVVMYFEEDVNPMVVNRTNAQLLAIATGSQNAGEARGKQVVVYNDHSISFGGKVTGGIRIKKIAGAPSSVPSKQLETEENPF